MADACDATCARAARILRTIGHDDLADQLTDLGIAAVARAERAEGEARRLRELNDRHGRNLSALGSAGGNNLSGYTIREVDDLERERDDARAQLAERDRVINELTVLFARMSDPDDLLFIPHPKVQRVVASARAASRPSPDTTEATG